MGVHTRDGTRRKGAMLTHSPAFSGFSVDDLDAAERFYGGLLGLGTDRAMEGVLDIDLGGSGRAIAYLKADHVPATFTVLNFPVADIDATAAALVAAGVRLLTYPALGAFDATGIHRGDGHPDLAWFADPAGNILSVLGGPGVP